MQQYSLPIRRQLDEPQANRHSTPSFTRQGVAACADAGNALTEEKVNRKRLGPTEVMLDIFQALNCTSELL